MNGGEWSYVEGGMGSVSDCIRKEGERLGVEVRCDSTVNQIMVDEKDNSVCGVKLVGGEELCSNVVLSNLTPHTTFNTLLCERSRGRLDGGFVNKLDNLDYASATTKINLALNSIPDFTAFTDTKYGEVGAEHEGTIHLGCETMEQLHTGYLEAERGENSRLPLIEMTIPSVGDKTLVEKEGHHVVNLFVQYER